MEITHFGHACVVLEDPADNNGRILIDPGTLADDVSGIGDIRSLLITHEHPDHLELEKLASLRRVNPDMTLYVNPGAEAHLPPAEQERAIVVDGTCQATVDIGDQAVGVVTTTHATIYPGLPEITNNAYMVGGRLWHPGDAFVTPEAGAEILLLPIGAPWMKISESIDYLRRVAPRVAIPIHQGGLAPAHRSLHVELLRKFAPTGTEVMVLEPRTPIRL